MKLTCFSLQMVLFVCACGFVLHTNQGVASAQVDTGVYCGNRLLRTLEFVCNSNYNYKRFGSDAYKYSNSLKSTNNLPYLNRNSPISFLVKRALAVRGVVDECCTRSCDYEVLLTYCGTTTQQPNRISSGQGVASEFQDLAFS